MATTGGAAMIVAGSIVLGVAAYGLFFEAFGHWYARGGGTVNSPHGPLWKESNAEINRRVQRADARTFAHMRRARPYFLAALVVGIALIVAGAILGAT